MRLRSGTITPYDKTFTQHVFVETIYEWLKLLDDTKYHNDNNTSREIMSGVIQLYFATC